MVSEYSKLPPMDEEFESMNQIDSAIRQELQVLDSVYGENGYQVIDGGDNEGGIKVLVDKSLTAEERDAVDHVAMKLKQLLAEKKAWESKK